MLFAPVAVFAQPDIEQQIRDGIVSEQAEQGAHSEALIPLFTQLGHLYREQGHEERAAAAFESARGVVRANHGFSSLDEAPLLEELIRIEEGLGYVEKAWEREHELLALAEAHPDDLRAADIYRGLGDKRLALLNRYFAGEFPPQLTLGCYYNRSHSTWEPSIVRNCSGGSRAELVGALSMEAWQYYSAAIKTLLDHRLYSSPELHDLKMQIVRGSYALGVYSVGRQSLVRLLDYEVEHDEPLLTRVNSLLQITDWDIDWMQKTGTRTIWDAALDTYEQTYETLRAEGVDTQTMRDLFAPDVPVVLPTFQPNPLVSHRTSATTGHIDVAFEVTKYGKAKRVQILDSTTNAPRAAEKELVRQIWRGVFRPRVIDGRVADAAPVVLRYYIASDPQ